MRLYISYTATWPFEDYRRDVMPSVSILWQYCVEQNGNHAQGGYTLRKRTVFTPVTGLLFEGFNNWILYTM